MQPSSNLVQANMILVQHSQHLTQAVKNLAQHAQSLKAITIDDANI